MADNKNEQSREEKKVVSKYTYTGPLKTVVSDGSSSNSGYAIDDKGQIRNDNGEVLGHGPVINVQTGDTHNTNTSSGGSTDRNGNKPTTNNKFKGAYVSDYYSEVNSVNELPVGECTSNYKVGDGEGAYDVGVDHAKEGGDFSSLNVKVNVDVSEALTGLKAVQREARKATQELRELEEMNKAFNGIGISVQLDGEKVAESLRKPAESILSKGVNRN